MEAAWVTFVILSSSFACGITDLRNGISRTNRRGHRPLPRHYAKNHDQPAGEGSRPHSRANRATVAGTARPAHPDHGRNGVFWMLAARELCLGKPATGS